MKLSNLLNKPTSSVSELAEKYKVSPAVVDKQLAQGIKVEMEHTRLQSVAREIALDHLGEDLHYYEKLSKIERNKVQEHQLFELFDLSQVPNDVIGPEMWLDNPYGTIYVFEVDNKKYEVLFRRDGDEVEITFSDEKGDIGITDSGNATKVFWAVAKSLAEYLKNHPSVHTITFVSYKDKPSRIKLYSVLSQRLAKQMAWHPSSKIDAEFVNYYVTKTPSRGLTKNSRLVELFDLSNAPAGVNPPLKASQEGKDTRYVFSVNNKKYLVVFTQTMDRDYQLKFKDAQGRSTITGAGDAPKVFWAVAAAMDMFVKDHAVAILRFGANEPSRTKLYDRLSAKMAETLGWRREMVKHPDDPAAYFRLYNPHYTKQSLEEGRNTSVIVVDVQPAYSPGNVTLFEKIIKFVVNQTGPILMFVNAEKDGQTYDTLADIKEYWEGIARGYEWHPDDPDWDPEPINWSRFQIVDKGYGYLRSWMDLGVDPAVIIKTIRLMYQNRVNDSRQLFGGEDSDDYAVNFQTFIGPEFKKWMLDDPIIVNWTSMAQLKRFSGSYIVGGGRKECLREVELLMNAFNIKYKRIDSMVYG